MAQSPIVLSGSESASNTDILNSTRLVTAPGNGRMRFQLVSTANDDTNNFEVSVQLPDGSIPLENVRVPAGTTAGALDSREILQFTAAVKAGGHVVFSATETGTAVLTWRVTFF